LTGNEAGAFVESRETFVVLDCAGEQCVAVHSPAHGERSPGRDIGVVIVVGGPQYRTGSHRQFVLLARDLARDGIPVLRFDYRGMGDSDGEARSFESIDDDIAAAIAALKRESGVARVVLWGLCDGASAALMYAARDRRVAGIVAANPWAHAPETEAHVRLRHYYLSRIASGDFWRKLLARRVDLKRGSTELFQAIKMRPGGSSISSGTAYLQRMRDGWRRFEGPVLFLLSGHDYTAKEFEHWVASDAELSRMFCAPAMRIRRLEQADHTFSSRAWHEDVAKATAAWIAELSEISERDAPNG
jgi:exosortase A-associated hydrolase 1